MTQLDDALRGLKAHEGVEHVLLVGTDGLLVRHIGDSGDPDPERVAAMLPGVLTASSSLARSAGGGRSSTVVIEMEDGVAIAASVSAELLLAVLVRAGVGFGALLRSLRRERGRGADLF
jgi:predicted regulator of Ras-like GTPase activity (Roadblock/LC7/MglB family)